MLNFLSQLADKFLFDRQLESASRPLSLLVRILRFPYAVLRDVMSGDLTLRAMSLVYTTLLSIVPLLAFSFSVLKGFGYHKEKFESQAALQENKELIIALKVSHFWLDDGLHCFNSAGSLKLRV